jgi:hypothetical protein
MPSTAHRGEIESHAHLIGVSSGQLLSTSCRPFFSRVSESSLSDEGHKSPLAKKKPAMNANVLTA